jgi:ABC-2 type transport system ATP-binding protein
VVVADGLSKTYEPYGRLMQVVLRSPISEPVRALDSVSFELAPGEVCVVLGANGAGKSTLFRILTGLTTPTAGSARVGGHSVVSDSARIRRMVGFAPADDRTLLLRHTCRENLLFHGRMHGMSGRSLEARIDQTLDVVGLGGKHGTTGFALSSGMRARLQIARAILHEPEVLILDEPTGAIDPLGARKIIDMVRKVAAAGGTSVLLSSHRLEEIDELSERVMVLHRGRIAFGGDLGQLRSQWAEPIFDLGFPEPAQAVAAEARLIESALAGAAIEILSAHAERLAVLAPHAGDLIAALGPSAIELASVDQRRMTLLEVLARLLGETESTR